MDRNNKPTSFLFDLVEGSSPLIIGLDVLKYSNILNLLPDPCVIIRRQIDSFPRVFDTYIAPDPICDSQDMRLRIAITIQPNASVSSLMSNLQLRSRRSPLLFSKQIHRFTHASADDVKSLCKHAGIMTKELESAIDKVHSACEVCAKNGQPRNSKKVSLNHVNEAFNQEIQMDFTFCDIRGIKQSLIVVTDTGTRYTECSIVVKKDIDTIINMLESLWICRHGAPENISADDEYHRRKLTTFLDAHDIKFKARPSRRHNKVGIVERKNGTLKQIIRRLDADVTTADARTIVHRATFLSNLFSGSRLLSSFELVRGYSPSVLGLPKTEVSEQLFQAHIEQTSTRALQRLIKSRVHETPPPHIFKPGAPVWICYNSSKQNEKSEWVLAKVVQAEQHFLLARKSTRGPPMRVAYEDVRIAPEGRLTQELMSCSLEEVLVHHSADGGVNHIEVDTVHLPSRNLMTSEQRPKGPEDDIGLHALRVQNASYDTHAPISSDKSRILNEIHGVIGSHQVTAGKLAFAPPWISEQAFETEHKNNWSHAYKEVPEREVPRFANVISSHVVYKVKTNEMGNRELKARIVPHGNRDKEKDTIRKDSATAQLGIIRLLLSIVTFLRFRLGMVDIKGAYLQSGPIQREIFVRPPREWQGRRGLLWLLTKLPYGIVEAGRQWQKTVESWMLRDGKLERIIGLSQIFVERNTTGKVILIVAKVTDDFLIGGLVPAIKSFIYRMKLRFQIGKEVVDQKFLFDGCEIEQYKDESIKMSMHRYIDRINLISISRQRRKQMNEPVTEEEKKQYRSLAGTLLYLGNGVLRQAAFVTSMFQQKISALSVRHLVDANNMLTELLNLDPWLKCLKPQKVDSVVISSFSDASHPKDRDFGQTGIICGLRIQAKGKQDIFHMLDWSSHKQKRVSYSSYGAEILACARAEDRGFYLKEAINSLFPKRCTRHELSIDSNALKETITTLHESTEYRLRQTVQRLRNSFEARQLNILRWIPGTENIADALTKRNITLY